MAAVEFIKNFAVINGLPQPAAPRGRAKLPPVYLPAFQNRTYVHKQYCTAAGGTAMSYMAFCKLWQGRTQPLKKGGYMDRQEP